MLAPLRIWDMNTGNIKRIEVHLNGSKLKYHLVYIRQEDGRAPEETFIIIEHEEARTLLEMNRVP